mmetsp:Transcript_24758/g.62141  ORF Transcript_24758/g.62141 Transcript_24758/m.62141 type:complete len:117 (+) Transcript_24758:3411-3761(+)
MFSVSSRDPSSSPPTMPSPSSSTSPSSAASLSSSCTSCAMTRWIIFSGFGAYLYREGMVDPKAVDAAKALHRELDQRALSTRRYTRGVGLTLIAVGTLSLAHHLYEMYTTESQVSL